MSDIGGDGREFADGLEEGPRQTAARDLPPEPEGMNEERKSVARASGIGMTGAGEGVEEGLRESHLVRACEFLVEAYEEGDAERYNALLSEAYRLAIGGLSARPVVTAEAIDRDPWNAVKLNWPQEPSTDLALLVRETAYELRNHAASEAVSVSDPETVQRWHKLWDEANQRREDAWVVYDRALTREAWQSHEFSHATINRDPWTAVYLAVPADADRNLLQKARQRVSELQRAVGEDRASDLGPAVDRASYTREGNSAAAAARLSLLDSRIEAVRAVDSMLIAPSSAEKARHTEGPWYDERGQVRENGTDVIIASIVGLIADDEQIANARLIESAPKLHAAASRALEYLTEHGIDLDGELEELVAGIRLELKEALGRERSGPVDDVMTIEAIERDPWVAVDKAIPREPSDELLKTAREAASCCRKAAVHDVLAEPDPDDISPVQKAYVVKRLVAARARLAELDEIAYARGWMDNVQAADRDPEKANLIDMILKQWGYTIEKRGSDYVVVQFDGSSPEQEYHRSPTIDVLDDRLIAEASRVLEFLTEEGVELDDEAEDLLDGIKIWERAMLRAWQSPAVTPMGMVADPWTAVYLPIPENAPHALLIEVQRRNDLCRERAIEGEPHSVPLLRQNLARAEARASELEVRLEAGRREEFRAEDFMIRPWDVVHKRIPREADAAMLWWARDVVLDCLRRLDKDDVELTEERFTERYAAATARVDELDARLKIAREVSLARPLDTLMDINYDIDRHPELTDADIATLDLEQDGPAPEDENPKINSTGPDIGVGAGDQASPPNRIDDSYIGFTRDEDERAQEEARVFDDPDMERSR